MSPDAIIEWLASGSAAQRDKLATVRQRYIATIRAFHDDDHARVIRELKKRINSKKLADELAATLVEITQQRAPNPRPGATVAARVEPELPPGTYATRREELEAAIAVDPDAQAPYLPYGDYLESLGDPFGPLIAMDRELAKNPGHKAMKVAREQHVRANQGALMGPLADCSDMIFEVAWHMGFIKRCRISRTHKRGTSLPDVHFVDLLGWLLDEPGPGRFLQELHLLHEPKRERPASLAIAARPRPSLRKLELDCDAITGIVEMLSALPNLRELHVSSAFFAPHEIAHAARMLPKLEIVSFTRGDLDQPQAQAFAAATWPSLHTLRIESNADHADPAPVVDDFLPLFDGTRTPALRHLALHGLHGGDALCELLAPSPLFRQLESLDLTRGTIGERGAVALLAHREQLANVAFTAEDNYIPRAFCDQLAEVARECNVHGQRDDGGDPNARFVDAYE